MAPKSQLNRSASIAAPTNHTRARATGFEKVRLPLLSRAGDTLEIEALAERRLADEYDAAQERSDVSVKGQHGAHVPDKNVRPTAADIVLARKETQEARAILDAETAIPGIVRSTVNAVIGTGKEPTKPWSRPIRDRASILKTSIHGGKKA